MENIRVPEPWYGDHHRCLLSLILTSGICPAAATAALASMNAPAPSPTPAVSFPVPFQQPTVPAVPAPFPNPLLPALAALTQAQSLQPPVQFPPAVQTVAPVVKARQALVMALDGQEQAVQDFANLLGKVTSDASQSNIMVDSVFTDYNTARTFLTFELIVETAACQIFNFRIMFH